jgi:hypothetical protein
MIWLDLANTWLSKNNYTSQLHNLIIEKIQHIITTPFYQEATPAYA